MSDHLAEAVETIFREVLKERVAEELRPGDSPLLGLCDYPTIKATREWMKAVNLERQTRLAAVRALRYWREEQKCARESWQVPPQHAHPSQPIPCVGIGLSDNAGPDGFGQQKYFNLLQNMVKAQFAQKHPELLQVSHEDDIHNDEVINKILTENGWTHNLDNLEAAYAVAKTDGKLKLQPVPNGPEALSAQAVED